MIVAQLAIVTVVPRIAAVTHRLGMALCITELQDTCIVDEDQQLHLAGKLGQALLSENQMLKKEVRELKNAIATLENVRILITYYICSAPIYLTNIRVFP